MMYRSADGTRRASLRVGRITITIIRERRPLGKTKEAFKGWMPAHVWRWQKDKAINIARAWAKEGRTV